MHTTSQTNTFFLPGKEYSQEQEAGYCFLKALAEEFGGEEIYSHRIFRLLYHLDGLLAVAQVGEPCPVYHKTVVAIFETCCTYLVVSEGHIYSPLAIRKDQVVEVTDFRQEGAYLEAS